MALFYSGSYGKSFPQRAGAWSFVAFGLLTLKQPGISMQLGPDVSSWWPMVDADYHPSRWDSNTMHQHERLLSRGMKHMAVIRPNQ